MTQALLETKEIAKALIHRTDDDTYLILRSSQREENPERSLKPDFAGGSLEPGESVENALIREIEEEAGLILSPGDLKLFWKQESEHPAGFILIRNIFYIAVSGDLEVKLSFEHDKFWWLTKDEINKQVEDGLWRDPYPEIFREAEKQGLLV